MSFISSPVRSGQRSSGTLLNGGAATVNVTIAPVLDITKCLVVVERVSGNYGGLAYVWFGARIINTTTVEISWNQADSADKTVYFNVIEFK